MKKTLSQKRKARAITASSKKLRFMDANPANVLTKWASQVMTEVVLETATLLALPVTQPSSFDAPSEIALKGPSDLKSLLEGISKEATFYNWKVISFLRGLYSL